MKADGLGLGDVLCVRTRSFWGWWIRAGSWLKRQGARTDHVVVVHHRDEAGTLWGIEGRPGGAGWVDLTNCSYTLVSSNVAQSKSPGERERICAVVEGLLQVPYDWSAIVAGAMRAIGAGLMWRSVDWGDKAPAHVVCSSLADWVYESLGMATPKPDRWVSPADWDVFNRAGRW